MPAYSFEALDAQGETRRGVMEADTAKAVRGMLRAQALVPLQVLPVGSGSAANEQNFGLSSAVFSRSVFNSTRLAIWTRQLAGLVSSGLPLERALTSLSDEAERDNEHHLVALLRAEVNGGSTFAKALSQHPREFTPIFIAVIGAGEQSGNLGLVLERLLLFQVVSEALKH